MIRVTVEMWPGGDQSKKYEIARVDVSNVSDLAEVSDYGTYAVVGKDRFAGGVEKHRRSDGWAALLTRVFHQMTAAGVK